MAKLIMLAVCGMLIITAGCNVRGNPESASVPPEALPVVTLREKDTSLQQAYVASIQAFQNVEIRAKVPGFIDKILVDEGQPVKKGQLLFIIDDDEYQAQLAHAAASLSSAEAEAKTAELELDRVKILVNKNIIAKSEHALAESKLKFAQAKVMEAKSIQENARLKIAYTNIRAPFDGVIDRLPFKSGSLVTEGNLLTTVSDLESVYAYFNVSENEYLHYIKTKKPDQPLMDDVVLVLADGTTYASKGKVETMENVFDENTGSIAFRAKFINPDRFLKHGATGKIKLTTRVEDVLMVPQKAVLEMQDKNYVFVVGKDSTVKMTNFIPGATVNEFVIIKSGLSSGDAVVYEGIQQLRDGSSIMPKFIKLDSTLASL